MARATHCARSLGKGPNPICAAAPEHSGAAFPRISQQPPPGHSTHPQAAAPPLKPPPCPPQAVMLQPIRDGPAGLRRCGATPPAGGGCWGRRGGGGRAPNQSGELPWAALPQHWGNAASRGQGREPGAAPTKACGMEGSVKPSGVRTAWGPEKRAPRPGRRLGGWAGRQGRGRGPARGVEAAGADAQQRPRPARPAPRRGARAYGGGSVSMSTTVFLTSASTPACALRGSLATRVQRSP
jgi:hypothetical protein